MNARSSIAAILLALAILLVSGQPAFASLHKDITYFSSLKDRSFGTSGCEAAGTYIEDRFIELGLEPVRQLIQTPMRVHEGSSLSLPGLRVPLSPLLANAISPQTLPRQGLTGPAVYAGHGTLHEMNGLPIKGSIVIMEIDSYKNWQNAAMLGAGAIIFLDRYNSPKSFFSDKQELTPLNMPVFVVSGQQVDQYFHSLTPGTPSVFADSATLNSSMHWSAPVAENIMAFIPGTDETLSEQLVIVEAFYDASTFVPGEAPGADQSASIATLLDMAEQLSRAPQKRTVLLLATVGKDNNLAGMREFVWAIRTKSKHFKDQARSFNRRLNTAKQALTILQSDSPFTNLMADNAYPARDALDMQVKNMVDLLSHQLMQLRLADKNAHHAEIEQLSQERKILRQLSWEGAYGELTEQHITLLKQLLPSAVEHMQKVAHHTQLQLDLVSSARKIRSMVVGGYETAAVLSLHLSSHGNGVGAFNHGFLYDIRPDRNRNPHYSIIDRVIKKRVAELESSDPQTAALFKDTLRPSRLRPWKTYFLDKPHLGGEVAALGGYLGLTFATTDDARPTWGTPYDTIDEVDFDNLERQRDLVTQMVAGICDSPEPLYEELPRLGIAELNGEANFIRQGELFPDQPAPGTIIQAYQGSAVYYAIVGPTGEFKLSGICDKKNTFHKVILEGYRFDENGHPVWAIDKNKTGKNSYRVKMTRRVMKTTLVMFAARPVTLFNLLEPRTFNYMTKLKLFDGRRETAPMRYWYSRIDTRQSSMAAVFLEPTVPVKLTLSDSVLNKKLVLTNASPEQSTGKGYLPTNWPQLRATEFHIASDMWQLLGPRIANLEEHGIINDRIAALQEKGLEALEDARKAYEALQYDTFLEQSRSSWALATRVYNDVEKTQSDVLVGVLFYIALFIPFAYCTERLVFAAADIHKKIAGFTGILIFVIAIIYNVHPAFKLTYAPLVVILAFFIVGLSAMVSFIIFMRFEKEMENLQRRSQHIKASEISRWKAFGAAFVIGVSNLRRRKLRTGLTITTLVILTFTIMSFTAVKSVRSKTSVKFSSDSAYNGILMKALGWSSMPPEAYSIITNRYAESALVGPRVWLENEDRTRAAFIPIDLKGPDGISDRQATARGMVGLSWKEAQISGIESILTGGSWFSPQDLQSVILPARLATQLGIDPHNPSGTVALWGLPFKVVGCFDAEQLEKRPDLDGEVLTPAIFPSEAVIEMNETQAEALESGEDVQAFQSRYQHLPSEQIAIVPARTAMAFGGSLKAMAIKPIGDADVALTAGEMVDRFGLTLFAGLDDGTHVFHATDSLNYAGVPNIIVPLAIAVLIVLNTMISSVYERKREIAVYTSVGMAPTHVSYLFIAESLAFAVLSVVLGYLLAQTTASLLSGTSLWSGMTANYSSLAGVSAMLLVIAVTLLSVIYPSKVAADIAIPDVNRSWTMPDNDGQTLTVTLPFLLKYPEQKCIGGFLLEYYQAHQDVTHGLFCADDISCSMACPMPTPLTAGNLPSSVTEDPCLSLSANIWLAPFDFGVKQKVELSFCPATSLPEFLEIQVHIEREAGEVGMWKRINKSFLNDVRKQLLVWRSMEKDMQNKYEEIVNRMLKIESSADTVQLDTAKEQGE